MLNIIILMLLMLPYIRFSEYALPDTLNTILAILRIFSIIFIFFFYFKQKKYSPIIILITIYQLLLLFSTFINHGLVSEQIKSLISITSFSMLFDMEIKNNPRRLLKATSLLFCLITILCVFTMFKYYPIGMFIDARLDNNYYLLGEDNASFFDILPSIAYIGLYELLTRKKISIRTIIYSIIITIAFIYVNSTTAFVCLLGIVFFELTSKLKIWNFILSYKNILIFSIISFLILMFIGISNISFLVDFVQNKLGKSLTLTGRTIIWSNALNYISQSPLIGYGFEDYITLVQKFNINHVHNIILQILYNGGIIGLTIFILINYNVALKLKKYKNTQFYKFLIFIIFIFFIASQFDYYNKRFLIFTLFIIGYNIEYLVEDAKK